MTRAASPRPRIRTPEALRGLPVHGAVPMGACDKTGPGLLPRALHTGVPAIVLTAGPMLRGARYGKAPGSESTEHRNQRRAGRITWGGLTGLDPGVPRSHGSRMTTGCPTATSAGRM